LKINTYKVLIRKPDGLFSLRCEDNIKIDVTEIRLKVCGLDSFGSGEGMVAGFCAFGKKKLGILSHKDIS
jgi:hypothetical protein